MTGSKLERLNQTTWRGGGEDTFEDDLDVVVGDDKQPDFKPQMKVEKWGNEANISIRLADEDAISVEQNSDGEIYAETSSGKEVFLYEKSPTDDIFVGDEGAFELELVLPEKPDDNEFRFTVESKGVKFEKQERLTEEEKGRDPDTEIFETERLDELSELGPGDVLDLGTGVGDLVRKLRSRGIEAIGLDNSDKAYQKRETDHFVQADALQGLPFKDDSFDLVTCYGFLKYVPEEEAPYLLNEIERVANRAWFALGEGMVEPEDSPEKVNNWSRGRWESEASKAGLEAEVVEITQKRKWRPPHIKGSYAIYLEQERATFEGGNEYRTGKVGHIYRPHLVDNSGKEVWGEVRLEDGDLYVEAPEEFLNSAEYPVIVDPTLGYDTVGGSLYTMIDSMAYNKYTLSTGANVSKHTVHFEWTLCDDREIGVDSGIYSDNGDGTASYVADTPAKDQTGVDSIRTTTNEPAAWRDMPYNTDASVSAGDIWLVFNAESVSCYSGASDANLSYDTVSGTQTGAIPDQVVWPSSLNTDDTGNEKFSHYITYESSGPGAPQNVAIIDSSTEDELTLDWDEASGAAGYYVYRSESPFSDVSNATQVADVTAPPYTDTGLEDGERFYYRVTSHD